MMKMVAHILVVVFLSITSSVVYADDPSPLQDICVADLKSEDGEAAFIASHQLLSLSKDGYLPENYKCNANITLTFKNKSGSNVPIFHSKHGRRPSTQTP
ncbi:hypothetical protein MRB53_018801 [Persea americana]|uniref:Uncharacterized protein n=1 Tax=Persea americana TaxID=3435 RepID=A0ACC2MAC6_PERAE|nr:hypothetical protein MRB53_018801 [Persea americana]